MVLKARIIPCLDVMDGRIVKGISFANLKDAGDPVEAAIAYNAAGADELCFLDITASLHNRDTILGIVERTAEHCFMPFTVGGGIKSINDIRKLLNAGADKITINTTAIKNPDFIKCAADKFGNQCIVVAIDAKRVSKKNEHLRWEIFTHGGHNETGIDAIQFAKIAENNGAGEILLTSMDQDGCKTGYDIDLIRAVSSIVKIPVIASGGVGELKHLVDGILDGGASAVLAASIFHFNTYTISQAKAYMHACGIPVRISN